MKNTSRIITVLAVLALAAAACQRGPTSAKADSNILFKDDFTSQSASWSRVDDSSQGITEYADGGYRIYVDRANYYLWSNPDKVTQIPGDVHIEVDAAKVGGPDANDMGLICRYTDENNFYFFTVGSDGYYGISKIKDGNESLLGADKLQFDDKNIHTGNAANHLRVDCVGNKLSLYANGKLLLQAEDGDFSKGTVGLLAGAYDTSGVDILFKNFVVMKP